MYEYQDLIPMPLQIGIQAYGVNYGVIQVQPLCSSNQLSKCSNVLHSVISVKCRYKSSRQLIYKGIGILTLSS